MAQAKTPSPRPRARGQAQSAAGQGGGRGRQRGGFLIGLIVGLLVGLGVALMVALYITKAPVPFINKVPQRSAEQDAAEAERNKHWDPNAPLAGKNPARPQALPPPEAAASAAEAASAPLPGVSPAPVLPDGTPLNAAAAARAAAASAAKAAQAKTASASAPAPAPATAASRPARDPAAILAGQDPNTGALRPAGAASAAAAAPTPSPVQFYVQAGAYSVPEDAEAQRAKLALLGLTGRVLSREQAGRTVYRVRVGPYDNRNAAEDVQDKLIGAGIEANLVRVER